MGTLELFVFLCTLQFLQGIQGSGLLDSLTCVNNYHTLWRCQWKQSAKAHELLPMNLIHWSDISSNKSKICEPDDSGEIKDGELYMTCHINETFVYSMTTTYTFKPKRGVSRSTQIIPNSNVRMSPPEGLMVQKYGLKNDSVTLRWRMPDDISYPSLLLYQVTFYRKDSESWEEAPVLDILGKTEVSFSTQLFVPGSTYLFRVRSILDKEQLHRSAWSKSIAWMRPEEEDKAIPQNLHCEYDGSTKMKCSWEVTKELSSTSYMLYYKDGATNEEKSCNNLSSQMKAGTPYVLYSCTFQILSTEANRSFHIQIRPKEELRMLKPFEHIQTDPPTYLEIKDPSNYKYKLGWSPPVVTSSTIKLTYQLCYWKQGDEECPDQLLRNISGNLPEYYIPSSELLSSTNYIAKVRAKPDGGFNGPWSAWSHSYSWKTDNAVSSVTLGVSAFFISGVILFFMYLWFMCFNRLKEQWKNSIPDPGKSKLSKFPLGYQGPNFSQFINRDLYTEVEGPLVSLQISPIELPHTTCDVPEEFVVESPSKPSASPLGPYSMAPPTTQKVQHEQGSSEDAEGTHDVDEKSLLQPTEQLSKMASNNAYFIFTGARSMSDLIAKESKSSDYFMPPKFFIPPKVSIPSCQAVSPGNQMSYVLNMEKQPPPQTPLKDNDNKLEFKKSGYFTVPSPAEVQIPQEGPFMIINPDGTGPLVLKQVGDYCFFPGSRGSQENLERKMAPANGKMHPQMPRDAPLSAVQAFKVMQRDYLALPQN
ncbi:cytokine receptor common subunit beta [Leptodactylus fuscus]|uniref:cytokine receptor common subunit beta n=1 Tax=Leptodactylus fuscus TaxID=238119 RepID=UPI003F4E5105